jgi:ABC-type lipoprotein export system ATPase subunit
MVSTTTYVYQNFNLLMNLKVKFHNVLIYNSNGDFNP